jgi:hypothetical protein
MSAPEYTTFYKVDKYGQYNIIGQLEDNLKSFLDYAFLSIGAFTNVNNPANSLYGGNFHTLNSVNDPSYADNTVYETVRKDWVWDTDVSYSGVSPIDISGVYVNGTIAPGPTGNSDYSYTLDYPQGRVVFNNPLSSSDNVTMNYSYRNVQVYKDNESDWFKELQQNSYDPTKFSSISGLINTHRIQMPCIIIELVPGTELVPYRIGSIDHIIRQDLVLHILTEKYVDRAYLVDILLLQKDKVIKLYDIKKIVENSVYPINYNGSKNANLLNYAEISSDSTYFLRRCYFKDINLVDLDYLTGSILRASIRLQTEIYP